MTINLGMPEVKELKPRITVFGVGGAGGNAVSNMIRSELQGVDFVVANTDAQALAQSTCQRRIQLGVAVTQGLGAGSRPEIGAAAAEESLDEIREHLSGAHMAFITAGMGGGTGTGAAPIIARAAREQGLLTVGVITKPFQFEGARRMRVAEAGILELQQFVDTLIIIPNQNLFRIANEKTTFAQAFAMADEVLHAGVRGITDLMVMPGLINLDFADIRTVMNEMGKAMMGTGESQGDNRAVEAAEAAISNPLLDEVSMKGAKGVLIHITGGMDLTLFEVDEAANRIRSEVDPDANIIVGSTFSDALEGRMRVSVVATGIEAEPRTLDVMRNDPAGGRVAMKVRPLSSSSTVVTPPPNPVNTQLRALAERVQIEIPAAREKTEQRPAAEEKAEPARAAREEALAALEPQQAARPMPARAETPAAGPPREALMVRERKSEPPVLGSAERSTAAMRTDESAGQGGGILGTRKKKRASNFFERMTSASGLLGGSVPAKSAHQPRMGGEGEAAERRIAERAAPPPRTREAGAETSASDKLLPATFEEEQLEIPAFLRRQAN